MSISMEPEREVAVSDARTQFADLVDEAESGTITYLTRRGHRVAAIVPVELPAAAGSAQVRAFARQFAASHPKLLERLADS